MRGTSCGTCWSTDNSSYTAENGHYADNFIDCRVGADMDLTPRNLLYVNATTGHHSGGFNDNISLASGASIAPTYKPERLYSIEAAARTSRRTSG